MQRTYRTAKGTELPLLNLRGREYLEVKYRLVWFREEHPDWSIETELLSVTQDNAYARATIKDATGRVIATSHKFENKTGFPDFIEKAETGAIGRALALIGYGTQFCADELDEGERIVDAPVSPPAQRHSASASGAAASSSASPPPAGASSASQSVSSSSSPRPSVAARSEEPAGASAVEAAPLVGEESVREGAQAAPGAQSASIPKDAGEYRISFGRKYKGMRLKDIARTELEGYMEWLEDNASKKGLPLSEEARFLKVAVSRYLQQAGPQRQAAASAPRPEPASH